MKQHSDMQQRLISKFQQQIITLLLLFLGFLLAYIYIKFFVFTKTYRVKVSLKEFLFSVSAIGIFLLWSFRRLIFLSFHLTKRVMSYEIDQKRNYVNRLQDQLSRLLLEKAQFKERTISIPADIEKSILHTEWRLNSAKTELARLKEEEDELRVVKIRTLSQYIRYSFGVM